MRRMVPQVVPHVVPHWSHIRCKRGLFFYRRRLPGSDGGELAVSLRTSIWREAVVRADALDAAFDWARGMLLSEKDPAAVRQKIKAVLQAELQSRLDDDFRRRAKRLPTRPAYAHYWWEPGDEGDAYNADLREIDTALASERHYRERGPSPEMLESAEELGRKHGIPDEYVRALAIGLVETRIEAWEIARKRSLDREPLFKLSGPKEYDRAPERSASQDGGSAAENGLGPDGSTAPVGTVAEQRAEPAEQAPTVSSLLEAFLEHCAATLRHNGHNINQTRGTLRRFIEVAGDKPVNSFSRGDVTRFLDALRKLPATYGRSPADKDKSVQELIERAEQTSAPRLTEKTVKRHLSALSQFFKFVRDQGHLKVAEVTELVEGWTFRADKSAKKQRDGWAPEELKHLFTSPIWTGRDAQSPYRPGSHIIRDEKFWLPLLALYQGARLEELADLYRRDIGRADGRWCIQITPTEGRRLKTANAARTIPLHPEIIRVGFIDYVRSIAAGPDDPLFPQLERQGADQKRGPRFTRFFVHYRRQIGKYRDGVAMHAFRHTANTRLRDVIKEVNQERDLDYLFGHGRGGSEGRQRYDKGPGLQSVASTLSLLRYPELDFSSLYVEGADQRAAEVQGADAVLSA